MSKRIERMRSRIKTKPVDFLGEQLFLRNLSQRERIDFLKHFGEQLDANNIKPEQVEPFQKHLLSTCVVDERGERVFSPEDVDALLSEFPASETDRLLNEIMSSNFGTDQPEGVKSAERSLDPALASTRDPAV